MTIRLKVHAMCDECSEKSEAVSVGERGAATYRESRLAIEKLGWLVTQGDRRTLCPPCIGKGKRRKR